MREGFFQVERPEGQRWATALDLLQAGTAVVLQDFVLEPRPDDLRVSVISRWQHPNEHAAREQLEQAQEAIKGLLSSDPDFASIVANRRIHLELIDDYGMGATTICLLDEEGALHWT